MATYTEYISPYNIDIPTTDLTSFIFPPVREKWFDSPQYFDADNPADHFSLNEAELLVKRVAQGLQRLGLRKNEKVLLFSGNQLYFPVVIWATVAAGCVFTGCNPSASLQELSFQLHDSEAKVLITGAKSVSRALQAAQEIGMPKEKIFIFGTEEQTQQECLKYGLKPWTSFWSSPEDARSWQWERFTTLEESSSMTATLNYSSGTTGLPKGVECSHYNLISNGLQVLHKRNLVADTSEGRARKQRLEKSGERWLAPLPMYHAYGQAYFCINAAKSGVKVFIMKEYSIDRYMTFMDIYRITYMASVPTIMAMLSKHPKTSLFDFSSVEQVVSGSAPLGRDIAQLVEQRALRPDVQVKQGWGMTETTCSATGFAPDDVDDGTSVGWLNANVRARIVPVDDRTFDGIKFPVGEIWISAPNIMKGYFNRPEETAGAIAYQDGYRWLRTGDIGYFDEKERLHIVDRLKELIKVKGLQVAPAELEAILLSHPGVQDAAVAAVKRDGNEYPRGYVVRKSTSVKAEELVKLVEKRCAKHKWLTAGVQFVVEIPRTASGKVQRRKLPDVPLENIASKL